MEGQSLEVGRPAGLRPGSLRRWRLTGLPFGFLDGSGEKSAEEDTTQSHRGVVSAQLYGEDGEGAAKGLVSWA